MSSGDEAGDHRGSPLPGTSKRARKPVGARARLSEIDTVIFDMDGTLYEDPRVYNRHARELAGYLMPQVRRRFLADWRAHRDGLGVVRVGMGYQEEGDRLFRFDRRRITSHVDWEGKESRVESGGEFEWATRGLDESGPGGKFFHVGDLWGLLTALATHYGLEREERHAAFMATREAMGEDEFRLPQDPKLLDTLRHLRSAGIRLVAASNSPEKAVDDTLVELGMIDLFDEVVASAGKPARFEALLASSDHPERALSVGDHYINDIEPALEAGAYALYIDRHRTELGAGLPHCFHVPTRAAMRRWLAGHVSGHK